jgi:two-component system nitrate/nitrite response regulator NarL
MAVDLRLSTTVVLADRNALVRNVLDAVCERIGVRVVGHASTGWELLAQCQARHPTIAVTDTMLADGPVDGCLDAVMSTGAKVVVLCDDASPERLTALLERGASGYLLHDTSPEHVGDALVAIAAGAAVLHPIVTDTILQQWRRLRSAGMTGGGSAPRSALTPRELEVLSAMADGLATKAIAHRLGVALKTIENHKIRIFDKLGVRTQAEAVSLAIGHSLLATATE